VGHRAILRTSRTGALEAQQLLQLLVVADLVVPSPCVWVVTPWISDIVILDNRHNRFAGFCADWEGTQVRLARVLRAFVENGTEVVLVTRPNERHNDAFREKLRQLGCLGDGGASVTLRDEGHDNLHFKGLLTAHCFLRGSMNVTYNGLEILEEGIEFDTVGDASGRQSIADARVWLYENYGGIR
jgi:hypothetical protein